MNITTISTQNLEEISERNVRSIRALKAWSNRKLSNAKRLALLTDIRVQQDAIITELMARENKGA
jgi:hypothetical protein